MQKYSHDRRKLIKKLVYKAPILFILGSLNWTPLYAASDGSGYGNGNGNSYGYSI